MTWDPLRTYLTQFQFDFSPVQYSKMTDINGFCFFVFITLVLIFEESAIGQYCTVYKLYTREELCFAVILNFETQVVIMVAQHPFGFQQQKGNLVSITIYFASYSIEKCLHEIIEKTMDSANTVPEIEMILAFTILFQFIAMSFCKLQSNQAS